MGTLTLVGTRLATVGEEFVYHGAAEACEGCPYRDQCLTLTEGRRYRITSVREDASTLDCAVHDTGVTAVEVEPAPVRATVADDNAFAGSETALEGPCPHTSCPSHEFCEPVGAAFGESYRISEVLGDPPHEHCLLDRELTLVEFEPPDDA
jgi:uncharacterized protein (UPF0179 family)